MVQFFQQLVNGLSLGSIYALIALGYTMVYGIINLINFYHGDIYMIGAYVGFIVAIKFKLGFFPSLFSAMIICAVLGVTIESIAYKPLRNATRITALITAIGISYFLEASVQQVMSTTPKAFPQLLPVGNIDLLGVKISYQQIIVLFTTVILMLILQFVVNKTKIGRAMRAVSVDSDAALLMGVDVNKTISVTFAIGSALAGAAGVLVGIYYNSINPLMGLVPGLKAFIAAVFGGIGIIPGAMIGGVFIGVIEALVSGYGNSLYRDAVVYIVLIIILVVKPAGLLGKNVKEKV